MMLGGDDCHSCSDLSDSRRRVGDPNVSIEELEELASPRSPGFFLDELTL